MAAPINDTFAGAILLEDDHGSVLVDTTDATNDDEGDLQPDGAWVWYYWIAGATGYAAFQTRHDPATEGDGEAVTDTKIAIYTGTTVEDLALVFEDDDTTSHEDQSFGLIVIPVTEGTTYYILVNSDYYSSPGTFYLDWIAPCAVVVAQDDGCADITLEDIKNSVAAEVGADVFALLGDADTQIALWYNQAQSRLLHYKAESCDFSWVKGDREIDLPCPFIQIDKILWDSGVRPETFRPFGDKLVISNTSTGACSDGSARLYYWREWPKVTSTKGSEQSEGGNSACLYYTISRFYRLLATGRAFYKRYSTLLGANAVSMSDLQLESDRYYQDFLDSRTDLVPLPDAAFFGG